MDNSKKPKNELSDTDKVKALRMGITVDALAKTSLAVDQQNNDLSMYDIDNLAKKIELAQDNAKSTVERAPQKLDQDLFADMQNDQEQGQDMSQASYAPDQKLDFEVLEKFELVEILKEQKEKAEKYIESLKANGMEIPENDTFTKLDQQYEQDQETVAQLNGTEVSAANDDLQSDKMDQKLEKADKKAKEETNESTTAASQNSHKSLSKEQLNEIIQSQISR